MFVKRRRMQGRMEDAMWGSEFLSPERHVPVMPLWSTTTGHCNMPLYAHSFHVHDVCGETAGAVGGEPGAVRAVRTDGVRIRAAAFLIVRDWRSSAAATAGALCGSSRVAHSAGA